MKKRTSIFLVVASILGLVFCVSSHAASGALNVESVVNVDVYGPSKNDFAGTPSGTVGKAATLSSVPSGWPTATTDPDLKGAAWITPPTPLPVDLTTPYSLFQDSFIPPCTASNLTGTLYTAANNVETVYFNKLSIGTTTDSGSSGPPVVNSFGFTPVQGNNTFDFDVTTQEANPPALIYNAAISFTLPDVLWRPPILGTGRTILKDGTTLPIKFVLKTNGVVLHKMQQVNLTITGPNVTASFSGQSLKFAPGNGQYLVNFHTKNYNLQVGAQYTVSVNDACSGTLIGLPITMTISGKAPHGKK